MRGHLLESIHLPEFYCPFPPALSPHVEAVQPHLNQWMQERRYIRTDAALRRFEAGRFAWVTGRAHPDADFESVLIVATYMSWLFMVDDLCDEAALGREPERLRAQHQELIQAMRHPRPGQREENPLVAGLSEIWERMRRRAPPGWEERFIRSFEDYTQGCQWEAENRARHRIPPLAEYMEHRRRSSALYLFFDLIELVEQVSLPDQIHEQAHTLKVLANDMVAWFNDIVSFEKELRAGDVHNLVILLQHEYRLSTQSAVDQAARLFNARMREYVDLQQRMPSHGAELDGAVQRYLMGLRSWVRGNMDWSYETGRYGKART
ncbi:terpene synthase family protein [Hyalangium gracile]|uniref:terpene synthase family protein n=1 Tax=Hyalangium gracile TaxID=394092 RepID=UPI001CCC838F|nr:hypothetical protein [Hyalangium gracile]